MKRWTVILSALWFWNAASSTMAAPRPNILFIVSDDQGWNDIGYHNAEMRTPNLDRLAKGGVELDCHYVQPQCSPTRVALLTGCYPSRFGLDCCRATNEPTFPLGTATIASLLKDAGYATGMSGKWHVGPNADWGPNRFGFDYSHGSYSGAVGMYDHRYVPGHPLEITWHRDREIIPGYENGTHATDLTAGEAVKWIENHVEIGEPWFFYVPFHAPHLPLVEQDEKWHEMNKHISSPDRHLYAAAVSHMDSAVGRMIEALERTNQLQRTIVIFTSDNGAQEDWRGGNYPPPNPHVRNFSSNKPLRGAKSTAYEGGCRVPAFVNWAGTLAARKIVAPLHVVDWAPTLAGLAGCESRHDLQWDGIDLWPILTGEKAAPVERSIYIVWGFKREWEALRYGDWKIVRRKGRPWELYDLSADPNETKNLADAHSDKRKELIERYEQVRSRDAVPDTTEKEPSAISKQ
ncbi:MAG: arylsulfatase [Pirellulales bacterium]